MVRFSPFDPANDGIGYRVEYQKNNYIHIIWRRIGWNEEKIGDHQSKDDADQKRYDHFHGKHQLVKLILIKYTNFRLMNQMKIF